MRWHGNGACRTMLLCSLDSAPFIVDAQDSLLEFLGLEYAKLLSFPACHSEWAATLLGLCTTLCFIPKALMWESGYLSWRCRIFLPFCESCRPQLLLIGHLGPSPPFYLLTVGIEEWNQFANVYFLVIQLTNAKNF